MKKALRNIALVAGLMGMATAAYGPDAKARNYSGGVTWYDECRRPVGNVEWEGPPGCTDEEIREQYVYGSYKEEVINEGGTVALHAEETREIAAYPREKTALSYCYASGMLWDFRNRIGRAVDAESEQYISDRADCSDDHN